MGFIFDKYLGRWFLYSTEIVFIPLIKFKTQTWKIHFLYVSYWWREGLVEGAPNNFFTQNNMCLINDHLYSETRWKTIALNIAISDNCKYVDVGKNDSRFYARWSI